jgi:hypothetical protein
MAVNEKKHGDQLAERRLALFGDEPARVKLDDIFDVEAPDVGAPRWDMSEFKAYQVALSSEQKAFAFYDRALRSEPADVGAFSSRTKKRSHSRSRDHRELPPSKGQR